MKLTKRLLSLAMVFTLIFVFTPPLSADAACSHRNTIYTGQTQVTDRVSSYHAVEMVTGWVSCTVTAHDYYDIDKCTDCGAYFPVFSHTTYTHSRYH